jgi:hypothetical protein
MVLFWHTYCRENQIWGGINFIREDLTMDVLPSKIIEQMAFAEKRAFNRISAKIEARFFFGNIFYSGTVLNISEKGMFINTRRVLPSDAMFVIIIREDNELLKVIAKVKRVVYSTAEKQGMGVELLSPSVGYLQFINSLRARA